MPKEFLDARLCTRVYGLGVNNLFENFDVALLTYRWGFRTLIDEATGVAWQLYKGDIETLEPGMIKNKFLPSMSRADFEQQFGKAILEPGYFVRFIGVIGNLFPNVGPLARLPYKPLPPNVRLLYFGAFHKASEQYRLELAKLNVREPELPDLILDTGGPDQTGTYPQADKAYADYSLRRHAKDHFTHVPKTLADDLQKHFHDRNAALKFEESENDQQETLSALNEFEVTMKHRLQ